MPTDISSMKDLHDKFIDAHREFYKNDPSGQLPAVVVMYNALGQGHAMGIDMPPPEERDELAKSLKLMAKVIKAEAYVFFSEAWHTEVSPEPGVPIPQPSKVEGRKECVITIAVSKSGERIGSVMEIERDWETGAASLKEPDYMTDDGRGFGGRFVELFDD